MSTRPVSTRLTPIAAAVHFALAGLISVASVSAFAQQADTTLPEVKIIGTSERGYDAKLSSTATKTDTLLRDTPQAITVVSKELIRDQAMQSMGEVLRYVPGIVTSQGEGNRDAAIFRGNASTGDFYIDGMRDDVQYFRDFYNIDSVEALKGPNAMIFGRGGSGGVINRVTKQPEWGNASAASLTLGSWNNRRATVDINRAVDKQMAFRLNAMVEDAESFRQGVKIERAGINPTLGLRVSDATSMVFSYEHFRDDRVADRGIPSRNGAPVDTDPSTFFGSAENSPTWVNVDALSAVIDHDFGNGLTLRNRSRFADYDKFYQNVYAASAVSASNTVNVRGYSNETQRSNAFNQTDLIYSLSTGSVQHKLLAGFEFGQQTTDNFRRTAYLGDNPLQADVPLSDPVYTGAVQFRQSASDADNHSVAKSQAVYLQDQISFTPSWQAVIGLRYDRFNMNFINNRSGVTIKQTDTPVSPRFGLIYKPATEVSIYASFSRSYVPRAGDQLTSLNASNTMLDPEQFDNMELGAKWDVSDDLSATAAIYQLDRSNVIVASSIPGDNSSLADGQTSKGIELGLSGKITDTWSVMGAYAYQDATLTAAIGSSPSGQVLSQVPDHTFSLWNRIDLSERFGAGLGLVFRDRIYASISNKVTLPSYGRVDGALYYTVNKNYRLQVNIENLFDKKYYASAHNDNNITPGAPRQLRAVLNATF